ncbi:hypothetical protein D1007_33416 [Hordeum vulgare]|nr:hypothetical protein D1007_33416 [Hordeum vulgare]
MASGASSSSSGSRSSGITPLAAFKTEPVEMPNRRRTHSSGNLVINKGAPTGGCRQLVRPKKEQVTSVAIKPEHAAMVADLNTGLKWPCDDYIHKEMERQRHALEEIAERHCLEEADAIILSDEKKETPAQTAPTRIGHAGQGCRKDSDAQDNNNEGGNDDDDEDGGN